MELVTSLFSAFYFKEWIIAVGLLFISFKIKEWYNAWKVVKALKSFPSPPSHWLFGHTLQDPFKDGLQWLLDATENHNRGFILWLGGLNFMLLLNHPDHLREIFTSSEELSKKPFEVYRFLEDWLGNSGLILSNGDLWHRHRKLLTRCFHFSTLKENVGIMNKTADVFLNIISEFAARNEAIPAMEYMSRYSFDTLLRTVFSTETDCQREPSALRMVLKKLTDDFVLRVKNPFLANDFLFFLSGYYFTHKKAVKEFHSVQKGLLRDRQQEILQTPTKKTTLDFIDTLLLARNDAGKGLSKKEIVDEMNSILFAGKETISSALTFFLYAMCKNPEHQLKVQKEIDDVLGYQKDVRWEDLPRLEYLTWSLKESIRMYDVVASARELTRDWEVDGYTIPKKCSVFFIPYLLHHNPAIWGDDHMEFRPERFDSETSKDRDPFAYLPFAAGQRNCIGQNFAMCELKVFSTKVLREFTVTLERDSIIQYGGMARPKEDFLIKFTKREKTAVE